MNTIRPDALVARFIAMAGGNLENAANKLGTSASNLSRWRSGQSRPRKQLEERMRSMVDGTGDLVAIAETSPLEEHLRRLEECIAGTLHSLREEFHRTASVSKRQDVLDLVSVLFFTHVTSIDNGGNGIGRHLLDESPLAVGALNKFVSRALSEYLPKQKQKKDAGHEIDLDRFFAPLTTHDERFAQRVLQIFENDAAAFRELHKTGRDDLINEVFSRFMSASFVDEKEMGQYLTPPELVRFMVEVGFRALRPSTRAQMLGGKGKVTGGLILDPSCGVGSFLAETIRYAHTQYRTDSKNVEIGQWLSDFVASRVVGIDKSERMIRLGAINLGLFGAKAANLHLANALGRTGRDGELANTLNGKVELILTNPPFGATFGGGELDGFAMGAGRNRADSEVLFLERYVDWLAPGGIIVSVVPDSVLVNRGVFAQLRRWLIERCVVEGVFSMPPVAFAAAGTGTKTSVLVLRKRHDNTEAQATFFGEAREIGFDVVTRSGQRRRVRSERTDLPALLMEYFGERDPKLGSYHLLSENDDRWDAAFHVGIRNDIAATADGGDRFLKVAQVAELVDKRIDPRHLETNEFQYIEISDVDVRTGIVGSKTLPKDEAPSRARRLVKAGDILVSTVRPERGATGVVPPHLSGAVCSTGFAVLRATGIHPVVLAWLLKTDAVKQQMIRNNIGIAYPAISEETCLNLALPITMEQLAEVTRAAEQLNAAQQAFENAHTQFAGLINNVQLLATKSDGELRQMPDFLNAAKPGAVSDAA